MKPWTIKFAHFLFFISFPIETQAYLIGEAIVMPLALSSVIESLIIGEEQETESATVRQLGPGTQEEFLGELNPEGAPEIRTV